MTLSILAVEPPLETLSDDELLQGLTTICATNNQMLARLIAYLVEVERRDLHARAAYCSMYDFCKRRLGLSTGSAFRRLTASRLARSFPIIIERLHRGAVTLEALVALRKHLTAENVVELLDAVAHKTSQQVEALIAARFPKPRIAGPIRALASTARPEIDETAAEDGAFAASTSSRRSSRMKPSSANGVDITFTINKELAEQIEGVADLMRHRNIDGDLETILAAAIPLLREKLEKEVRGKTARPLAKARPCKPGRIPEATKRAVFERDGEQCTYVSAEGERCPETALLEIHHVKSKARGGSEDVENLCVRCRTHNQLDAKQVFGRHHVQAKIDFRRRKSEARGKSVPRAARNERRQYRTPSAT